MLLKLSQAKKNTIINWIANAKLIILNKENNLVAWDFRDKREKDRTFAIKKVKIEVIKS